MYKSERTAAKLRNGIRVRLGLKFSVEVRVSCVLLFSEFWRDLCNLLSSCIFEVDYDWLGDEAVLQRPDSSAFSSVFIHWLGCWESERTGGFSNI